MIFQDDNAMPADDQQDEDAGTEETTDEGSDEATEDEGGEEESM